MKKNFVLKYLINIMFFLYFLVLIIERTLSVTLSVKNGIDFFGSGYNIFVYFTVFISVFGFITYIFIKCRYCIKALFIVNNESIDKIDFSSLVVASGILLLSGMVHSEYTFLYIQFVSYAFLIIGIILKTVLNQSNTTNKKILWFSTVFLISYSMAIPVVYKVELECSTMFYILEGTTTYFLVGFFTYMTLCLFNNNSNLFKYAFMIPTILLDVVILAMRWQEVINMFLLIFLVLTIIIFVIGRIMLIYNKKSIRLKE